MTTSAQEWREKRNKGVEIKLPEFDDVVFIRPMDVGLFFKAGRIPDFLSKTVADLINRVTGQVEQPTDMTPEQTKEWLTWLDELVKWTFVSPKVVDNPREGEDEISVDDIGLIDKLFIYSLFGQPAHVLRSFRAKQVASLAVVDVAKNNGTYAVEVVGDSAVGQSPVGDA